MTILLQKVLIVTNYMTNFKFFFVPKSFKLEGRNGLHNLIPTYQASFFCLIFPSVWVERLYFALWSMGSFPSQRKLNETVKKTPAGLI